MGQRRHKGTVGQSFLDGGNQIGGQARFDDIAQSAASPGRVDEVRILMDGQKDHLSLGAQLESQ